MDQQPHTAPMHETRASSAAAVQSSVVFGSSVDTSCCGSAANALASQ